MGNGIPFSFLWGTMKPFNLSDPPNTPGFQFPGVFGDGHTEICEVVFDEIRQLHVIKDNKFSQLVGWFPYHLDN